MSLAESVRQRLLNYSRSRAEPFNFVLTRFALERLLYRISKSGWQSNFLLKGAMLFHLWYHAPYRPTKDLDLMAYGVSSTIHIQQLFRSLCNLEVEEDGLEFLSESVTADEIREGNLYRGVRVKLISKLAGARISLQIDIGFGDSVVPEPEYIDFPTLLPFPSPRIRSYSKYNVVAEKFQAMVTLGILNSRMKDFFDICIMAREFEFSGKILAEAIASTFKRRSTEISLKVPLALTEVFSNDKVKKVQWDAFLRKNKLDMEGTSFQGMIQFLSTFLLPPLTSLANKSSFDMLWIANGPWTKIEQEKIKQN